MMWFLIAQSNEEKWFRFELRYGAFNIDTIKREYREHGIPIIAIARRKLAPSTDHSDYDAFD